MSLGLRLKLGLYVLGFVASVFVLVGYLQMRNEREIYIEEMKLRGLTVLSAFAIPCTVAMANNDSPTLDNYVVQYADAAALLDLRFLAVLDFQGKVVAHTHQAEFGKVYSDAFTLRALAAETPLHQVTTLNGEPILEMAVPMQSGLRWGTLRAGFTLSRVEEELARRQVRLALFGIAILIGVATIAFLGLSRAVVRPVLRMRDMARRFGSGDLGARVELTARDEMGQLAAQLNAMALQIQSYTGVLEEAVAARTTELEASNVQLEEANKKLERLARTDGLTGLYNRRHFMEQIEFEIRRAQRSEHPFAVVMLDMDHFKHYNDSNGHTAGDDLLRRFSALLQITLRSTDVIARYGGEEFIVLLLDTNPQEGAAAATKLRNVISSEPMPFDEKQPLGKVTASIGVAFYPQDGQEARTLIELADQALYDSKRNGRNRVTCFADMARPA